jgi:hypothetical protein
MERTAQTFCEVVLQSRATPMNAAGNAVRKRKIIVKCAAS